ncbi:MAG TPA: SRPBCC family protein [Pirellulaceae bacterium]|nr:SRPBCC family protein [Pirellulaceae bacterium]
MADRNNPVIGTFPVTVPWESTSVVKKVILSIVGACVLIVIGLVIAIALQPDTYAVQRSIAIDAAPSVVFPHVNDLQAWGTWTPWDELDPNAKITFTTPSAGEGAVFGWSGNDQIGEGTLTILKSVPDEHVEIEQAFVRPFAGKADMAFTFVPEGSGTRLTWKMSGTNGFVGKAMCMFMSMETMLGGKFEQGLSNIKKVAESSSVKAAE